MKDLTQEEVAKQLSQPVFHLISQAADELGVECYIVGGYVRDLYMGRPSDDIDIVVVGDALQLAKSFIKLTKKRIQPSIYGTSGAVLVKWFHKEIEFNTARGESYVRNSNEPQAIGTLEEDLHRRDFTINALAICLNKARFGELVDLFDGIWDLQDRIIDTPLHPDDTFEDDPLRMFRAIRFATRLYFTIHQDVIDSIQRNKEHIKQIAPERIAEEINKIMLSDNPSMGFELLFTTGLLQLVLPELHALYGVEKMNGRAHKDNFFHTLEVLENVAKATKGSEDNEHKLWLRWAALLHDIGKPKSKRWENHAGWTFHNHNTIGEKMVPEIFKRMKLPLNDKMKYVQKLVSLHMRPIVIADDVVTDSAVRRLLFEAGDDIDDLMTLCEADITSKNEVKKQRFLDNFKLVRKKLVDLEEKDRIRNFQPPVDGTEIMQVFHLEPGPKIKQIKDCIKDAILDGKIPNEHDAAYKLMLEKGKEIGLTAYLD